MPTLTGRCVLRTPRKALWEMQHLSNILVPGCQKSKGAKLPQHLLFSAKRKTITLCAVRRSTKSAAKKRSQIETQNSVEYVFRSTDGSQVSGRVEKSKKGYTVTISLPNRSPKDSTALLWGTFRSSPAKWFTPEEIIPPNSTAVERGEGMRTRFSEAASGQSEVAFTIPEKMAPLFLSFHVEIQAGGSTSLLGPPGGQHFAIPIGLSKGNPLKYGASLVSLAADGKSCSVNFAVVSRHASAMSLCITRRGADGSSGGFLEIALDPIVNRKGDVWHACVHGLKDLRSLCYGWRADADISWDAGNRFHPGQVMLDPYSPVAVTVQLPEGVNVPPPKKGLPAESSGSNPPALLGCLSSLLDAFDWEGSRRPHTSLENTLILELDIPSFSASQAAPHQQGKYLGVLDGLPEIKALGATAVMLTPVTVGGPGLGPFGRAPYSFFAPEMEFASSLETGAAAKELKQLIKGLHSAGLEVYLQVEYCLTGEGWDEDASAVSLRGLDAAVYYRAKGVLNCGHANVRALILDSLRHWARCYQVDGFCFVNAETLALDREGTVLDNPPLAEDIANDSDLRQLKLIAWAADDSLLPRGGERGFPHWATWLERNKRFTADFGAFFTGGGPPGIASTIATRICGSPDLLGAQWGSGLPGGLATGRRPSFGLNAASYLDKSPLSATVAAILPANAPYGQDFVLKKSLLFASLMCQGTPLVGADVLREPSLVHLVNQLMQLRKKVAELLVPMTFEIDRDLRWFGASPGVQPDWSGELAQAGVPAAAYLAYSVHGRDGSGIYVAYNPYEGPVPAILPDPPAGSQWKRAVDTSDDRQSVLPKQQWIPLSAPDYTVAAKASLLLVAVPLPKPPKPAAKPRTAVRDATAARPVSRTTPSPRF